MTTRVVDHPDELAALFGRDTHNHIYALADLDEPFWSASTWWRNGDAVFGLVGLPDGQRIVYAVSSTDPDATLALAAELVDQVLAVASTTGAVLVTGVTGIAEIYATAGARIRWQRGYNRFHLLDRSHVPTRRGDTIDLSAVDVDDALALYAIDPDAAFFLPTMLNDETFVGVRHDDGSLIAIAGTHVLSEDRNVAAIGAVFTHPAHRGRGLGAAVTAAAIHRIGDRVSTIGLNCTATNLAARRIYAAMGFVEALAYHECEVGVGA